MRTQTATAESFNLKNEIEIPSLQQFALVGVDVTETSPIIMDRLEAQGNNSGWFIGNLATELDYNDPKNLVQQSLFEVSYNKTDLVKFLGMPFNI